MQPRIEIISEKKLVGMHIKMTFAENTTAQLWQNFMSNRTEVANRLSKDYLSLQIYNPDFDFNSPTEFEKWALVEVSDFNNIPETMEPFILESGLYAVFTHKGSSIDNSSMQYIFKTWLPDSEFTLDDRPHFEVLGKKYKNNDPNSEEEIWIPIK